MMLIQSFCGNEKLPCNRCGKRARFSKKECQEVDQCLF